MDNRVVSRVTLVFHPPVLKVNFLPTSSANVSVLVSLIFIVAFPNNCLLRDEKIFLQNSLGVLLEQKLIKLTQCFALAKVNW